MNVRMLYLGLSLIVTLGIFPGRGYTQAPLVPSMVVDQTPPAPLEALFSRPAAQQPQHGRVKNALLNGGYCCQGDISWFGCGSWKSQATFVFGSCRTFFGEPCIDPASVPSLHRPTHQPPLIQE